GHNGFVLLPIFLSHRIPVDESTRGGTAASRLHWSYASRIGGGFHAKRSSSQARPRRHQICDRRQDFGRFRRNAHFFALSRVSRRPLRRPAPRPRSICPARANLAQLRYPLSGIAALTVPPHGGAAAVA